MPETRRQFSPQFKGEAVQMVVSLDRTTADVARDLGINVGTLANWVNAWRTNPDPASATKPVEVAHVAEMQAEIRWLRMENDFLRKAAAFREDSTVAERCALNEVEKATYATGRMCMLTGVPRSTFCGWRSRVETPTMARRRDVADHVRRAFIHSRKTYGCR